MKHSPHSSGAHTSKQKAQSPSSAANPADPAQQELERRLNAAKVTLATGNPTKIAEAEKSLLAVALLQMADLRMVQGAYLQGSVLYGQSLAFEESPEVRLKLGIADMRLKKLKEAIAEADRLIATDPSNAEAWRMKANSLMMQGDHKAAIAAFEHTLTLRGDVEDAYSLAVSFLSDHQPQKAALVFQDMIANYGDTGALHALIGRAYRDAGDLDQALSEFRRAVAIDPKAPHAHYFIALLLLQKSDWLVRSPEVYEQLHEELKINPRDFLANYILGSCSWEDRNFEAAESSLKLASEVNPGWPEPWLYLGLSKFDQQQYAEAEPLLRKAIELTGKDESRNNYQIRKAHLSLARILTKKGNTEEAQAEFKRARELQQSSLEQTQQQVSTMMAENGASGAVGAIVAIAQKPADEISPDMGSSDPAARFNGSRTSVLTPEQQQQAKAEEEFLRPIVATSFNDLGTAEAQSSHLADALAHFQQAEKWDPSIPNLSRNIGVAAMKLENYPEAARALGQHVASHPDDKIARAMLGVAYFMSGKFAESAQAIAPLDTLALQDPRLGYMWAASLAKSGQLKESAQVLDRLPTGQMPPEMLLLVGQTWGDAQHYDKAIELFHRASELQPGLPKAHYDAGLAYLRSDRPEPASKEFEQELAVSPNDLDAKYNLAFTLLQQSQRDRALQLLQEVTAQNPAHAEAQYQLGKLMLDQGKIADAVTHLELAAKSAPDKDYIHYQLQSAYRKAARPQDAERELALYKQLKGRGQQTDANSSPR